MLEDYRSYLVNIRNNLIQCGVEYPISPLNTYRDIFYLGYRLDSVIWYYRILCIGGSENALEGCMFPLGDYYKKLMRKVYYEEFRDFLEDYKNLSVIYLPLRGNSLEGGREVLEEDEVLDLFDGNEGVDEKEIDLFDEPLKEDKEPERVLEVPSTNPSQSDNSEITHGVYLDELDLSTLKGSDKKRKGIETQVHGIYLDELDLSTFGANDKGSEVEVHGIYLDELDLSTFNKESSEGYSSHGIYLDLVDLSIDKDCESVSNSVNLSIVDIESEGSYVEHGVYLDEVDLTVREEEGEEDEEFVSSFDFDDNEFEEEKDSKVKNEESEVKESEVPKPIEEHRVKEMDLSDYLQDTVNSLLTKGKRMLYNEIKSTKNER